MIVIQFYFEENSLNEKIFWKTLISSIKKFGGK